MDRSYTQYHGSDIIEQGQHDVSWEYVRAARNQALAESDWRAVKDRVLPNRWKDFRTFLRNLPQNFDSANDAADAWAAYDIPE
jgi:hypothetical protein